MQVTHNNGLENSKQPVNVAQLWAKYLGYWPLFAVICAITIASAWLYLKYEVPLYEATATILIKDERKGTEDSKISESLNVLDTKKIIENEIEVIQSRTLLNDVVSRLHLYAPVFEEAGLRHVSAYTTSPIEIEVQHPDQLVEAKKVSFTYDKDKGAVLLDKISYSINNWVSTPYGSLRFIVSKRNTTGSYGKLNFSLVNPKRVVQKIQEKLSTVLASKPSSILNLRLMDEVPERAEDILNELLLVYNNAVIHDKNALAANTLAFFN